jgi:hypothetical protein
MDLKTCEVCEEQPSVYNVQVRHINQDTGELTLINEANICESCGTSYNIRSVADYLASVPVEPSGGRPSPDCITQIADEYDAFFNAGEPKEAGDGE